MARMASCCSRLTIYLAVFVIVTACTSATEKVQFFPSPPPPAGTPAQVIVDETHLIGALPADFIGLSYEANILPLSTSFNVLQGNLVSLYHLLGQGNLRIGGSSVDHTTFWEPGGLAVPLWVNSVITPADLARLANFIRVTGWKVELAVNLGHLNVQSISSEAQYAASELGSRLVALECGNEPNYFPNSLRAEDYGYQQYKADFIACADAIGKKARIAGPDTTGPFVSQFVGDEGSRLTMLTQHFYALAHCGGYAASVADLLAARTDQEELSAVANALNAAQSAHLPVRIDEANSVDCGGVTGVSDTYASALWGIDYLLLMAQDGVAGINFHGGQSLCFGQNGLSGSYTPLCASSRTNLQKDIFTPQPLYYGMLFTHLLGTGRFYPVKVSTSRNLTAYALHGSDGKTRVMLVEKDSPNTTPLNVTLRAGKANGLAQVLRLTGSSLNNNQGIAIQGATVGLNGHFAPAGPGLVRGTDGEYVIHMAAGSAALVTLP